MKLLMSLMVILLGCLSLEPKVYGNDTSGTAEELAFVASVFCYQNVLRLGHDEHMRQHPGNWFMVKGAYEEAYNKLENISGSEYRLLDLGTILYPIFKRSLKTDILAQGTAAAHTYLTTHQDLSTSYFGELFADKIFDILSGGDFPPENVRLNNLIYASRAQVEKAYLAYLEKHPEMSNMLESQRAAHAADVKLKAQEQEDWEAANKVEIKLIASVVSYSLVLRHAHDATTRRFSESGPYDRAWFNIDKVLDLPRKFLDETIDSTIDKAMKTSRKLDAYNKGVDAGVAFLIKKREPSCAATAESYADKIVEILKPLGYGASNSKINLQISRARQEVKKAYLAYIEKYPENENLLAAKAKSTPNPGMSDTEVIFGIGIAGAGAFGLYQIVSWLTK